MEIPYKPIDCNLYDRFTEAATLHKTVHLRIESAHQIFEVDDQVVDLTTENKVEYITLKINGRHRLDKVQIL